MPIYFKGVECEEVHDEDVYHNYKWFKSVLLQRVFDSNKIARECKNQDFFSVSLILGPELDAMFPSSLSSSSCAITGGLVARGDGPWVPKVVGGRNDELGENRLSEGVPKPKLVLGVDIDGGLEAEGVGRGGAPELNSAHFGHLRFVSSE